MPPGLAHQERARSSVSARRVPVVDLHRATRQRCFLRARRSEPVMKQNPGKTAEGASLPRAPVERSAQVSHGKRPRSRPPRLQEAEIGLS